MRALVAILIGLFAAPVMAQEVYGPPDPAKVAATAAKEECPSASPRGEIVVCGALEDQSKFRVEGTETDGTEGAPRAPNVETQYPHSGMGVVFKGCFIPPCPPPMPKLIDLKALPDAPPGSDADRVARGLAPTGRDQLPVVPDLPPPLAPVEAIEAPRPPESPAPAEAPSG